MSATFTVPQPPAQAIKIGTFRGSIRITVWTQNSGVRLAKDRDTLETPNPRIGTSGLLITDADHQVQEEWNGELWVLGDPSNASQAIIEVDSDATIPVVTP